MSCLLAIVLAPPSATRRPTASTRVPPRQTMTRPSTFCQRRRGQLLGPSKPTDYGCIEVSKGRSGPNVGDLPNGVTVSCKTRFHFRFPAPTQCRLWRREAEVWAYATHTPCERSQPGQRVVSPLNDADRIVATPGRARSGKRRLASRSGLPDNQFMPVTWRGPAGEPGARGPARWFRDPAARTRPGLSPASLPR